jgi:hypothetical protein
MLGGGAMDIIEVIRGDGGVTHLLGGMLKIIFSGLGWVFVYIGVLLSGLIVSK